ncbi:MAG: TRAP transporter small permease [Rhodospirillales bacterium]|nr:TRAP transporter small permease [Rhodospirillales bacterium]
MTKDHALVRATDLAVTASGILAGVVLLALMLLTTADVAARYFLNSPINGVVDLTEFSVLIMTFLGFAYCGFRGANVAIELLFNKFGPVAQLWLKRLSNALGSTLFATIAWRSIIQSIDVREFNETSQLLTIPNWPFYYVVAFGAALFAWVMLLRIFVELPEENDVTTAEKSKDDPILGENP